LLGFVAAGRDAGSAPTTWPRPELEYFKAVNRLGPPRDPQLLLLLMAQYANAQLHRDGIAFFSSLVQEFEPRLSDRQKSLNLGAIGLLQAGPRGRCRGRAAPPAYTPSGGLAPTWRDASRQVTGLDQRGQDVADDPHT
jgi:hypothetical protein